MTRYGILDDAGQVVRWVWQQPGPGYLFVTVRVRRQRKPRPDLSQYEPAPF